MISFFLDQHGCAKNQVDGELLIARLESKGLEQADSPDTAQIIIVNSCGFIESAKKESLDSVMRARMSYPAAKILLAGCLAERYAAVFKDELPEVDAIFGNGDFNAVEKQRIQYCYDFDFSGFSVKKSMEVSTEYTNSSKNDNVKMEISNQTINEKELKDEIEKLKNELQELKNMFKKD